MASRPPLRAKMGRLIVFSWNGYRFEAILLFFEEIADACSNVMFVYGAYIV